MPTDAADDARGGRSVLHHVPAAIFMVAARAWCSVLAVRGALLVADVQRRASSTIFEGAEFLAPKQQKQGSIRGPQHGSNQRCAPEDLVCLPLTDATAQTLPQSGICPSPAADALDCRR